MNCIFLSEIYVLPIKYQCSLLTNCPLCNMAMIFFFKCNLRRHLKMNCMSMLDEIALGWMPHNTSNGKSTSVQVMAWWRQVTSHYLSQCWPRSMLPCGINSHASSSGYFCSRPLASNINIDKKLGDNELVEDKSYYWQYHKSPMVYGILLKKCQATTWTNVDLLPIRSLFSVVWWVINAS